MFTKCYVSYDLHWWPADSSRSIRSSKHAAYRLKNKKIRFFQSEQKRLLKGEKTVFLKTNHPAFFKAKQSAFVKANPIVFFKTDNSPFSRPTNANPCNRCRCKSLSRIPASPLCWIVVRVSRILFIFSHRCIDIVIVSKHNGRHLENDSLLRLLRLSPPIRLGQYRHHDRWFAVRANGFFSVRNR